LGREEAFEQKYKEGDLIHEASSYEVLDLKQDPHISVISSIELDGKDLRDFDNPLNDLNHTCFMEKVCRELINLVLY
jgi:hypothetical protein